MESILPPFDPNQHFRREIEQLTRDFSDQMESLVSKAVKRREMGTTVKRRQMKRLYVKPLAEARARARARSQMYEFKSSASHLAEEKESDPSVAKMIQRFASRMAEMTNCIPPDRKEMCCSPSPKHHSPFLEDTEAFSEDIDEPPFTMEDELLEDTEVLPAAYAYLAKDEDEEARLVAKMMGWGFKMNPVPPDREKVHWFPPDREEIGCTNHWFPFPEKYCSPKHCVPFPDDTEEAPFTMEDELLEDTEVLPAAYACLAKDEDRLARDSAKLLEMGFRMN